MAVSYSNVTQPGLLAQQYPPALLPKPGKDNARLQKLLKKSAKKKAAPQTVQTPAPFRSSLSPVNEASADLEHSDHSTPPKTPETPFYASQPPRFSVRPLYQHVSSPYPQQRGLSFGGRALFSPQPFSPPANVHPPYFYAPPPPHPGVPVVPGPVTQAVTTLTPGPTSSVSKITMPTVEMRIPAPIPVVETVSRTIRIPITVISPLMKPRSPRPTFKASLSRSPKPMFEVPQIQMYTANTYEVMKTPLIDSTGLAAIGGTTTQRRTPSSEIRRGLTPTPEVKIVLTLPSEIKRNVTPTLELKRALTPTSEVKRVLTPTSEVKITLTATSEVKRAVTPTSEVKRSLTPTPGIQRALTPTSEVKRSVTPTLDVKRGLTPTSEILRPKTPTYDSLPSRTSSGRPKTPSCHVTRSKTPVFEVSRPNPLLFAVSPITTETQRSKSPSPISPTAPTTETQQSNELVNAKSAATPNGVISLHENVSKPDAPRPEAIEVVKSTRPKTPTAPLSHQRPTTPTAPLGHQRPKTPTAPLGHQRPTTPTAPLSHQRPKTPTAPLGHQRPTTPTAPLGHQRPTTPTAPLGHQRSTTPTAPLGHHRPTTPTAPLGHQRPKTPTAPLHQRPTTPTAPLSHQRPKTPTAPLGHQRPTTPTAPLSHQRPTTPTAPLGHQRPKTPTAPLGHQRPKTPTNVSPKPTTTSYGYQRPKTPSHESPVAPTYGYQRPKTPLYDGSKPPTPATQTPKPPSQEPARPPVQSLRNQRPKTPIYGTSPRVSPLAFQRPKTPTHVSHQSKSTYYGLTPAEYVAHGGIQSHTPSFGLSRSKTPTLEESNNTEHAAEESNTAQQETGGKTQPLVEETHKEDETVLKQEVTSTPAMMVPTIVVSQASDVTTVLKQELTSTPAMMVPTIVVSQASDVTTVSSHEPQIAETPKVQTVLQETPKVQTVLQETPKVSAPETKIGIKTPAKKTQQSPVHDAPKPKTPITAVKPPVRLPANTSDSNKASPAKDAKQTAEKVHGTVTKTPQILNQTVDTKEPPKIKAPIKQVDGTKMVETVSTTSTPIEKDSAASEAVTKSPLPIKQMDTDQDKVKPVPALVPSTPPSASETKDTGCDMPAAEPLLKVIKKPKGMKLKLSGWSRLKKHMVVEVEEPMFPETCKSEAEKEDGPKISETRDDDGTAAKASEKSGSRDGDESGEPPKPKTIQMWDAVLFGMFSTKENIMQQIEASKSEDEKKEDSKDVVKEVPAFAHRLPVLLFSPRFDAKRLREAASRPLTKISTVFEMGLIGRKNKDEEPKDFNRTARGFATP